MVKRLLARCRAKRDRNDWIVYGDDGSLNELHRILLRMSVNSGADVSVRVGQQPARGSVRSAHVRLRKAKGWSQDELAAEVDIEQNAINLTEIGRANQRGCDRNRRPQLSADSAQDTRRP
jgi:nitric oxide reductase activation protein